MKKITFVICMSALLLVSCVSLKQHESGAGREIVIQEESINKEVVEKKIILKVLITNTVSILEFESDSKISIKDSSIEPANKLIVSLKEGDMYVNGEKSGNKIVLQTDTGLIKFGKNKFRGSFMVKNTGSKMEVINLVELEKYLYGVLPSEISPKWNIEVLKAQAVAARSFAIYQKLNSKDPDFDLDCSVMFQVYKGFDVEKETTNKAIENTYGEVLAYDNKVIQAFFHSNSGGRTASAEETWGGNLDYLKSVDDPYCSNQPHYKWNLILDKARIYDILRKNNVNTGEIYDIVPSEKTESGRIKTIKITGSNGSFAIKGKDFRAYFGVDTIKSTNFKIDQRNDKFYFEGFGWGHGVGLSQEGAAGMADKGFSYIDILKHFYVGAKIKKIEVK